MKAALRLFFLAWLVVLPAYAVEPDEVLQDATLEARARAISSELRCLVCQNQSIDDSHAPLARDLRVLVRQKLVDGESDEAIRGFLVDRYGDFILLKPRFSADTLVLWLAPFAILMFGGFALFQVSRRTLHDKAAPLDQDERRKLKALLDDKDKPTS